MVQTDNCSSYKVMKKEADVIVKGRKSDERFADSLPVIQQNICCRRSRLKRFIKIKLILG